MKQGGVIFAFIDSQNLNLAIQDQGWKLDFTRFRIYLKERYNVRKAFIGIGYIERYKNLYEYLSNSGYQLIFKPTVDIPGETKGNVDAELVLQAMIEYPNYDKAILVTGDGDFYCLANYLNAQGKLDRIIIPNQVRYSSLLKVFENKIDFLSSKKRLLEYKKSP